MSRRVRAPLKRCRECGCAEFDTLFQDGKSYVVCCKCLEEYELIGEDEEDEEEDEEEGDEPWRGMQ